MTGRAKKAAGNRNRPGVSRSSGENKTPVRRAHSMDYSIVFLVVFLVGFGLVMIYSTSSYKGALYYGDGAYWLKRQAIFALGGLVVMGFIARSDYHFWNKKKWFLGAYYLVTVGLLSVTLIFAALSHGSKRWIQIGPIRFQPSEVAKVSLIVMLAIYISKHVKELRQTKGVIKAFAIFCPILLLVGVENLSTCVILTLITLVMLFVATPKFRPFLYLGAVGVGGFILLVWREGYRMARIATWLNPEDSENGMQTMQGHYAIGSGGLFGKGLGQSMQKMGFLPEPHNDMIFSIVCEELGLFGAIGVIILYFILLWRFLRIALNAADLYGSMIAIGAIAHVGFQVFVNIGVVTNTIPNTGVPLPFISYGGTSVAFLLVEMGLVLSVSRYTRLGSSAGGISGKTRTSDSR